jgi:TusA-related sulfurtransferase
MERTTVMAGAVLLLLGGLAGAKGTTTSEDMTGKQERQMANCPSAVPDSKTTVENKKDGVALTVTGADAAARDEIRRRAHVQENVAMQSARGAIEHTGGGTGSGKFGFCPGMIQGTRVAVEEVPDGARLTVHAGSESQAQSLQKMTRARLRQLSAKR